MIILKDDKGKAGESTTCPMWIWTSSQQYYFFLIENSTSGGAPVEQILND